MYEHEKIKSNEIQKWRYIIVIRLVVLNAIHGPMSRNLDMLCLMYIFNKKCIRRNVCLIIY